MQNHIRRNVHKHVDKKLRNRLRLYVFISLILIGIVLFEVCTNVVSFPLALVGIVIGICFGFITSRMYHISWDHDAKQIVSRLDLFGIIILISYIIFSVFRKHIIEYFIHGPAVGGVSLSIATGVMIGRILGTRGKIITILKEQDVF